MVAILLLFWDKVMNRSLKETVAYYENLRDTVFEFVEKEYQAYGIKLKEISFRDAQEADSWKNEWKSEKRVASWEWSKLYMDYHSSSGIKRFDLALYMNGKLQALCYGAPSKGKYILKLHALERAPNDNPIRGKVLSMVLFTADAYARLIGAEELWLCNPVSPAHVKLYAKAGYEPHFNNLGTATHLSMRLK